MEEETLPMDEKDVIEVFLGLLWMSLVWVTAFLKDFFFLAWIGIWMVFITLFYHWHKIRKEAQKQGKEVVF
jgi:hypothetical protein